MHRVVNGVLELLPAHQILGPRSWSNMHAHALISYRHEGLASAEGSHLQRKFLKFFQFHLCCCSLLQVICGPTHDGKRVRGLLRLSN
jgi:hypothetical protein